MKVTIFLPVMFLKKKKNFHGDSTWDCLEEDEVD